jgi:hypothetical protein
MLYDFVPMSERRPLKWPNGKRLALMITFNLEEPPESHRLTSALLRLSLSPLRLQRYAR